MRIFITRPCGIISGLRGIKSLKKALPESEISNHDTSLLRLLQIAEMHFYGAGGSINFLNPIHFVICRMGCFKRVMSLAITVNWIPYVMPNAGIS